MTPAPFLDRDVEAQRLREAILKREGLLIVGPAGIGKTALVSRVIDDLPREVSRSTLYLSGLGGLQPLLRSLVRGLYEANDETLRKRLHGQGTRISFKEWLKGQPTSRLRGAAYRAMEGKHYWVFLDHIPPPTHAVAKVVRELMWMRNTPVYLLSRGLAPVDVGQVGDLYWSEQQRLHLGPLPATAARTLFEVCIQRWGLASFELDGFFEMVLSSSGRNPGAIIKMCGLAADPRYQHGSQFKAKLIHIDYLMSLKPRNARAGRFTLPSVQAAYGGR